MSWPPMLKPEDKEWAKIQAGEYFAELASLRGVPDKELDDYDFEVMKEVARWLVTRIANDRPTKIQTNLKNNPILREIPEVYIKEDDQ